MWVAKCPKRNLLGCKPSRCVKNDTPMKSQASDEVQGIDLAQSAPTAQYEKAKDVRGHEIAGLWALGSQF